MVSTVMGEPGARWGIGGPGGVGIGGVGVADGDGEGVRVRVAETVAVAAGAASVGLGAGGLACPAQPAASMAAANHRPTRPNPTDARWVNGRCGPRSSPL